MRLIVASVVDDAARNLARHWSALLLTPADLSHPGWLQADSPPYSSRGCADSVPFQAHEVSGILIRIPLVWPQELTQIAAADREYVAAEMTAFLAAFLSGIPCRKLNLPTGANLLGPPWGPQGWARIAAGIGIPVTARGERPAAVTVIGTMSIGTADEALLRQTARLAVKAGVPQLTAHYVEGRFLGAEPISDLSDPLVVGAMDDYLNGTL